MSDLEELARKGRSKRERSPTPASRPAEPRARVDPDVHRRMVNAVVMSTPLGSSTVMLGGALVTAVLGAVCAYYAGLGPMYVPIAGGGGAVGWMLLHFVGSRVLVLRSERRWLEGLPYHFPVQAYLDVLGEARKVTRVELSLRFEAPLPEDRRELVRDAAAGAHPRASASLAGAEELVISAELKTKADMQPGSDYSSNDRHTSEPVHAFVRTVLRDGVDPIHASHPIDRVAVRLAEVG